VLERGRTPPERRVRMSYATLAGGVTDARLLAECEAALYATAQCKPLNNDNLWKRTDGVLRLSANSSLVCVKPHLLKHGTAGLCTTTKEQCFRVLGRMGRELRLSPIIGWTAFIPSAIDSIGRAI